MLLNFKHSIVLLKPILTAGLFKWLSQLILIAEDGYSYRNEKTPCLSSVIRTCNRRMMYNKEFKLTFLPKSALII